MRLRRLFNDCAASQVVQRLFGFAPYFYELLEGNEKDRANKIQSRIAEMARHRLSTSSLQPHLWRMALAVSTSTSRK